MSPAPSTPATATNNDQEVNILYSLSLQGQNTNKCILFFSRHRQLLSQLTHLLNQLPKVVSKNAFIQGFSNKYFVTITGKPITNNNNTTTNNGNNGITQNPLPPTTIPKNERRRTVSFRKGIDAREELLRRSTTPDVKDVS